MGLFQEYLDSHGKVKKAKVDISGGDPDPKTPPTKPKDGKPYISQGKKTKGCKKGLGDCGDEELKYQPVKDKKAQGRKAAKIPTVEQTSLASTVSDVIAGNPEFVEKLVMEAKRQGVLGIILAEMLQHKATYNHMNELMESENHGREICGRISKVCLGNLFQKEEVAPPFPPAST